MTEMKTTVISQTTMRTLFALSVLFCSFTQVTAQLLPTSAGLASTLTGDELVEKYHGFEGAVLNMTREEWAVFRDWEGYDQRAHIEILQARKTEYNATREARRQARIARASDCDCWIEPDNSYTQVTTEDWVQFGGAGLDVDCFIGPISMNGWQFNLYGTNFNEFFINSKGTVSFGNGYINWTPTEFPAGIYDQLAAFWADADFRSTGELWYKVTPSAVYVNFIEVGYFNNHDDLFNTFQIVFTPAANGALGDDYNVQFCYLDMQWAHGDVGGNGGFNGPTPATVGCDRAAAAGAHIQYGRFNLNNATYNGPYGIAGNQQDGINWLDNKTLNINTTSAANNIPPIATQSFGCDDVTLCINDTLDINLQFLAPEAGQNVTITSSVDGDASGLFITSQSGGNVASIIGGFAGSAGNVGNHVLTITATDNGSPAASTEIVVNIEVIPVELPVLTVSGNFTTCAGAPTTLTASSGFDEYQWSTGCDTEVCEILGNGEFSVTASVGLCEATRVFDIEVTPYFLPCVEIAENPICSTETTLVTVCEDEQPDYVGYQWDANWNGLGGTIVENNNTQIEVTPGTYRLLVENAEGCFGQRVFVVESLDAFIPEDEISGAYCDGLEQVTFEGGFSNPAEGQLTLYLISSVNVGWQGSFINVYIDGEVVNTYTSTQAFTVIQQPITAGQDIQIEYVSSGIGNDANYSIQLFNCANSNQATLTGLENGILYEAPAGCTAQPALGEWVIESGPAGGSFSVTDQYNSVFTPGGYGLYEVCFYDIACENPYCYLLEYTQEPSIALNISEVLLCGDESVTITANIDDIGGTATLDWPAPGVDDVLSNTYSFDEPVQFDLIVTIENGCGSDEDTVEVTAQSNPQTPVIDDAILCEDGSIELAPFTNPGSDLEFEWTLNNGFLSDASEIVAVQSGTYCITVSNECFPQGITDCAEISLLDEIEAPIDPFRADCDGDGEGVLAVDLPSDEWTVFWPATGSTEFSITVTQGGVYEVQVTDPGNCGTTTYETNLFLGVAPVASPTPVLEAPLFLCPEITNTFNLGTTNGIDFSWSINCDIGVALEGGASLNVNSSSFSPECFGQTLTITGNASNPCGSTSAEWPVVVDACEIIIPNIFTPNSDGINDKYIIDGLDVYRDVAFTVYDRWGGKAYESTNYKNDQAWNGADVSDGTYFYVLVLPNGREYTGTINVATAR